MSAAGLGGRLYRARLRLQAELGREVTTGEVGTALGVTGVTVARWERGEREPDLATIAKLAAVLRETPGRLAFGDDADTVPEAPKAHRPAGQPHHGTAAPRGTGKAREEEPAAPRRSSGGRRRA